MCKESQRRQLGLVEEGIEVSQSKEIYKTYIDSILYVYGETVG